MIEKSGSLRGYRRGYAAAEGPLAGGDPPTVGMDLGLFGEPGYKTCFQGAKALTYQQATWSNPRGM